MERLCKILLWVVVSAGMGSGISSCRPDPLADLTAEDSQVFITNYDRSVNFANYRTFSLPDSVVVVSNNQEGTSASALELRFLDRLAQTLTSRGYQRVARSTNPDIGVAVIRISNQYVGVTTSPFSPYYLDYWGFGGYGFNYYPSYPNYYSFYQVSDDYWMIQMVDLRNRNTSDCQLNVIWQAEIRGSGIFDDASLDNLLSSVFSQSTYLRANQ
ncbi:DUF4136 domain-containing protein [Larkinella soli]|uniref:DUF4136 domain-containing protein n=1 Tax=Larkinella soli TaxID=1770527 RepID=UPI000FFC8111|nr:DUF4136 domain-containing protein [Larkinella soli]